VVKTVALNVDQTFSLDGLPAVVFEVKDGKAAFIHSDCPDQICVHSGFLGAVGQTAACLPNRAAIKIRGDVSDGVDAVA
jgi:hypothetical protein